MVLKIESNNNNGGASTPSQPKGNIMSKKDSKKDKVKVPFPTDSKGNKWDDEKGLYVTASGIQREVCCQMNY